MSTATEDPTNQTGNVMAIAMQALHQLHTTYRYITGPAQHAAHDLAAVCALIADLAGGQDADTALDTFRHSTGLCPFGKGHRNLNCRLTCVPPSSTLIQQ